MEYDIWVMKSLKDNKRIATTETLREAHEVITSEHRREYVYILKWSPATTVTTPKADAFGPGSRFGAAQGQHCTPEPTPTCKFVWGCLCNRVHTNDLR